MGLDKVVEEVLSSGERKRKEILDEADVEVQKLNAAAVAEVKEYEEQQVELRETVERFVPLPTAEPAHD